MLLAAGEGVRMRPLTFERPKPAIPLLGRPFAVHTLERMAAAGVQDASINLHHLPEVLEQTLKFADARRMPRLHFTYEPTILGTAGGIRNASEQLTGSGSILISNSDFVSDIDMAAVVASHRTSGFPATLVLTRADPHYSAVETDGTGRIRSLAGSPAVDTAIVAGRYLFTGCHVIEESVLNSIPEGKSDIVVDVYRDLAARGELGSFIHDGFWWEFGSPERYLDGCLRILELPGSARDKLFNHDPIRSSKEATVCVGDAVRLDESARLRGGIVLGRGAKVGSGAQLEECVLLNGASVPPGSRLRRVLLGPGVVLPEPTELANTVVCIDPGPGTPIRPPISRQNGLLLAPLAAHAGA